MEAWIGACMEGDVSFTRACLFSVPPCMRRRNHGSYVDCSSLFVTYLSLNTG